MQNPEDLQFHPPALWKSTHRADAHSDRGAHASLVGEVDDDNAWALGGAAGHAGLFGTAAAVGAFARHVMQVLDGRVGAFQPETLRTLSRDGKTCRTARARSAGTRCCRRPRAERACRRALSATPDSRARRSGLIPTSDVYVVLLTNRVYPDASNDAIQEVRRAVHDAVMRGDR